MTEADRTNSRNGGTPSEDKRELLKRKLKERLGESQSIHPLSPGQEALWFLYQLAPGSAAYNIMCAATIRTPLDVTALERALQALLDRHTALRTTYGALKGKPVQVVHETLPVAFAFLDGARWTENELRREVERRADEPFDLRRGVMRGTLFTRPAGEHVLLIVFHHIAIDFVSLDLILKELPELYRVTSSSAHLEPSTTTHLDFVRWQRAMVKEPGQKHWAYWHEQLSGELPVLELPHDRPRRALQSYTGDTQTLNFDEGLCARLREVAKEQGTTLYTLMLSALQVLLHRWSGQDEIVVGTPTLGRQNPQWANAVGYMTNPVALRTRISGELSFETLLGRVRETLVLALEHQDFPFATLVERLRLRRDPSRSPVFQVMFMWDKADQYGDATAKSDLVLEPFAFGQRGAPFELTFAVIEKKSTLSLIVIFNVDLFDACTIERMAQSFGTLLEGVAADVRQTVNKLPLLKPDEAERLLKQWNETAAVLPPNPWAHDLISAQAGKTPDTTAIVCGETSVTYAELEEKTNRLAHRLRSMGVGRNTLVGLCLERSINMVAGLLAILKAGGAYVPIDPDYPAARIHAMLSDARPSLILTQTSAVSLLPEPEGRAPVLCLDLESNQPSEVPGKPATVPVAAGDLAYVIYTSGSTGGPKGVQVSHRSLGNVLLGMRPRFVASDVLVAVTTVSFDIAALELLGPLVVGGRVIIVDRAVASDGLRLADTLEKASATIMQATPSTWRLLLDAGWKGGPHFTALSGGEALPQPLAGRLREHCAKVWNLYGPTETTIWSTSFELVEGQRSLVPIGKPIANTQVYILDSERQPVPVGMPGDLYIGGYGLSPGYLNRPELTREKFVPNPFGPSPESQLYRTGDLARQLADGNYEFMGRRDDQVKVKGYRIELGEIEARIASHPSVSACAVSVHDDGSGGKRLVAHVVPRRPLGSRPMELPDAERAALCAGKRIQSMPNGLIIAHHDSFQLNALYKEIFENQIYLTQGITIPDGATVLDVGANIGLFTLFAHRMARDVRVYAFEPLRPNFEFLQTNLALNGVNATAFQCGLWSSAKTASFAFYPRLAALSGQFPQEDKKLTRSILLSWLKASSLPAEQEHAYQQEIDTLVEENLTAEPHVCDLRTLSSVIRETGLECIDLLKVDAERSEVEILRGLAEEDWERIQQIVMEVHSSALLVEVGALLDAHGFSHHADPTIVVEAGVEYVYTLYARRPNKTPQAGRVHLSALPQAQNVEPAASASELRSFLKRTLPDYMAPGRYVFADALPMTANGKLDRKALRGPGTSRPTLAAPYLAPRDATETQLAETWQRALKIDRIGIHDNFFELGGASLHCLEVSATLKAAGIEVAPQMIFAHQTIAELAAEIAASRPPPPAKAAAPEPPPAAPSIGPAFVAGDWTVDKSCDLTIESLGVYLPPQVMSTSDVLSGCRNKVLFPLERMTGIQSRRVAGETEFSIDLAKKAIESCLMKSKHRPEDIDLLVCCNVSRYDAPGQWWLEPSTAARLRKTLGLSGALVFDISNACAGMFTGIMLVDALVKVGAVRVGLVASGEYITHLTQSAQKEIEGFMDPRLACLTVGDAGAAVLLERSSRVDCGFHELDMYTMGRYSSLCIAKVSSESHGGAIMHTDSMKQTAVAARSAVQHAVDVMERGGWRPEMFDRLIMHQTSETAMRDVVRALNDAFAKTVFHDGNTVYNLLQRGNTATTTHFVALADVILRNEIHNSEKVVFGISGSGQTVGTALYTFDNLPDRFRQGQATNGGSPRTSLRKARTPLPLGLPRVQVAAIATVPEGAIQNAGAVDIARAAAEMCLERSGYDRNEIELLIHAGVYKDEFLAEPALAALLAGALRMNDDVVSSGSRKTFVFDLMNGAVGFLNACQMARALIQARRFKTALITASEVDNNKGIPSVLPRGIAETGSAVILAPSRDGVTGFGNFVFRCEDAFSDALRTYAAPGETRTVLRVERDPEIQRLYADCLPGAVAELLEIEGLEMSRIALIFGPHFHGDLKAGLLQRLGISPECYVCAEDAGRDLFTSALPHALQSALSQGRVKSGDIGLLISVGSGIQVGCASYYF